MNNIKLIVWDMDGTLLNDKKEFPKEFFFILKLLKKKNIRYGVASGRQYARLKEQFKECADDMFFIADNGTINFFEGEFHNQRALDLEIAKKIDSVITRFEGAATIFCGASSCYILKKDEDVIAKAVPYYKTLKVIDDLVEIYDLNDQIYKLAIHDDVDSYRLISPINEIKGEYKAVVSGHEWVDVAYPGVNKGSALKMILEYYGLTSENALAFGDFGNDYELLKEAKYSYAMLNATEEIKSVANYITKKDNNHNGVLDIIKEYIFRKKGFIFDMDGLMLDTESIGLEMWIKTFKKYSIDIDKDFLLRLRGRNANSANAYFKECYPNLAIDFLKIREEKNILLREYLSKNVINKKKGVDNLLSYLKDKGYKLAVATSTSKEAATNNLKKTGLYDYFDTYIFGDQVEYSKPNPDIFLKASKALGLNCSDLLIFEDSLSGLMAAKNANIDSIWVPDGNAHLHEALDYCLLKVNDLDEVIAYLEMLEW